MKVIHGSRSGNDETATDEMTDFKTCPVCGALCFADMDICFGCLHRFDGSEPSRADLQSVIDQVPKKGKRRTPDRTIKEEQHREPVVPQTTKEDLEKLKVAESSKKTDELGAERKGHMHDIARPQKPAVLDTIEEASEVSPANNGMTSRHICSDKDGRRFEISISVKLL